jgi:hypothetical protein
MSEHSHYWLWAHIRCPHCDFTWSMSHANDCILNILHHSKGLTSLSLYLGDCFSDRYIKIL